MLIYALLLLMSTYTALPSLDWEHKAASLTAALIVEVAVLGRPHE
jgi:hypothetical protein